VLKEIGNKQGERETGKRRKGVEERGGGGKGGITILHQRWDMDPQETIFKGKFRRRVEPRGKVEKEGTCRRAAPPVLGNTQRNRTKIKFCGEEDF